MTEDKYAGFISYSHADEAVAARVHYALETFKIPRDLSPNIDKKLYPIFRDTTELTAHHSLSEKIQDAVNNSKFLIAICSPAAKSSHWVNEEIRLFRSLHGEASILCVLVEGTPEESFPPSLIEGGREPLAANLGTSRESFRLGVTQLAASMLGVGLDTLIQRETRRRRRRMQGVTATAAVFSIIMATTAFTAVTARNSAEISRTEAEKMVEFMLTDLKQDLEPVGRLNILDDVGKRVTDYYDAIPLPDMDDNRLARQARARHLLGQVAIDQGKMGKAKTEIDVGYIVTEEVLRRNRGNVDAIFAHAQSAYWLGEVSNKFEDYESTLKFWLEYNDLASQLHRRDANVADWTIEAAWGQHNLGAAYSRLGKLDVAIEHYDRAIYLFSEAKLLTSDDPTVDLEKANTLAIKSRDLFSLKQYEIALDTRKAELNLLENLENRHNNVDLQYRLFLTRLNYWEIKNEMDGTCNVDAPSEILELSKSFHEKDPSNYRWKRNYVAYTYDLIVLCQEDFSAFELAKRIDGLRNFAEAENINFFKYENGFKALKTDL